MKHVPARSPLGDSVDVLVDGRWVPGVLFSWRQRDDADRWEGYVHYTVSVGMTFVAHVDQDQLRPADAILGA